LSISISNIISASFLVFLLVFIINICPALADERIMEMNVTATVGRDATVTFEESIKFRTEGREIKRGIIRMIPTDYTGTPENKSKRYSAKFELISATLDGRSTGSDETRGRGNVEIRIGKSNSVLAHGVHTITLTYRTVGWIAFRESFDELYWNVTGADWPFPIDRATFRLVLPDGASVSRKTAYTGKIGARGGYYKINSGDVIETTMSLAPGECLTVAFGWNKGIVAPPPEAPAPRLLTSRSALVVILALCVLLYYFAAWYAVGRDEAPGRLIPLYRPPKYIEPGFARYLRDMKFSHEVLAADIIQLAVLGFVTFRDEGGVLRITQTEKAIGDGKANRLHELSEALRLVIEALTPVLSKSDGITVSDTYGDHFIRAEKSLRMVYEAEGKHYFSLNTGYSLAGLILFLPIIFLVPWTWPRLLATLRTVGMRMGTTGYFATRLYLTLARLSSWMQKTFVAIISVLGAVFAIVGLIDIFESDIGVFIALLVATGAAIFFSRLMSVRTTKGTRTMSEINGLIMYMKTAERHRLAVINPPDQTPELFETLLPYAFALDCAETWADSFSAILESVSYKPSWDTSRDWDSVGTWRYSPRLYANFGRNVDKSISGYKAAQAATKTADSSSYGGGSGFGSGGRAGGGGGGGGGHGW
jgi:uncharacterized membrane protein YgcG